MKNIVALIIAMIMLLAIASAEVVPSNAAISINGIRTAFFAEDGTYLPMQESDGLVYAPAEQLGSYLGLDVEAAANGVVKVNGIPVALFDENGAYLPSLVLDGVVYVPVKAFAESLSIAITVTGKSYALENAPGAQKTPEPTPVATQAPLYGYVPLTSSNFYDYFSVSSNVTSTNNTNVSPYWIYTTFNVVPTTYYDHANVRIKFVGYGGTETLSAAGQSTFKYSESYTRKGSTTQDQLAFATEVSMYEISALYAAQLVDIEVLSGTIRMSAAEAEKINSADYERACENYKKEHYEIALTQFEALASVDYLDSKEQVAVCRKAIKEAEEAKQAPLKAEYEAALSLYKEGKLEEALSKFKALSNSNYRDSADKASKIQEEILKNAFDHAVTLYNNKEYEKALAEFGQLINQKYKTTETTSWQKKCQDRISEEAYADAIAMLETDPQTAKAKLEAINPYQPAVDKLNELAFEEAMKLIETDEKAGLDALHKLKGYSKADEEWNKRKYAEAVALFENDQLEEARKIFVELGSYRDVTTILKNYKYYIGYDYAREQEEKGNYTNAYLAYEALGNFKDSEYRFRKCVLRDSAGPEHHTFFKYSYIVSKTNVKNGLVVVNVCDRVWNLKEDGKFEVQTRKTGKYGVMNMKGELVLPIQYSSYPRIGEQGIISINRGSNNGNSFVFDSNGYQLICKSYDISVFSDGLLQVNDRYFVNKSGQRVLDSTSVRLDDGTTKRLDKELTFKSSFSEGLALAWYRKKGDFTNYYVLVDKVGNIVANVNKATELKGEFCHGVVEVWSSADGNAVMNTKGRMVVNFQKSNFDGYPDFIMPVAWGDGYIGVKSAKNSLYGFVNLSGDTVIKNQYMNAGTFAFGMAPVQNSDGKWGYINTKGKTVIDFMYDDAGAFYPNGLAQVVKDGKCYLIDTNGNQITDIVLDAETNQLMFTFSETDDAIGYRFIENGIDKGYHFINSCGEQLIFVESKPQSAESDENQATDGETETAQTVKLTFKVGDTYKMGYYEQDNNTKNGKEAIEWIVADVQGDEALLISKYAIEAMAFNTETKEITWEKSSIRKWLNGDFVKNTFTTEEQAMIAAKSVNNDNTQGNRSKNGGATTTDQVFLLSYAEVQKYFTTNKQRICTITPYAAANAKAAYANTDNGKANGNCWWWLRTPGDSLEDRDVIETDGSRNHYYVNRKYGAVRPAMWIKLTITNTTGAKTETANVSTASEKPVVKKSVNVGEYITFGHYPQTKAGNDNTPIEWLVLAKDGNKALLISRYALDCQQYNSKYVAMTWQKCSLRTWLNGTFLNKAFTSNEQKGILITNVDNSKNQSESGTNGGNNTQDKVFLLSYAEAWKYFKDDSARMCVPTEYAIQQGAWTDSRYQVSGKVTCRWWLRSPGFRQDFAISVNTESHYLNNLVDGSNIAVRPALWVNLESGVF